MTVIKKHDGTDWQEVVVGESGQWNSAQTIRAETASTVLTSADAGRVIAMNSSSATAITVNGSTSFSPGQRVDFLRQGTGDVTIYGSGVTINGTPGSKLRARYSGASLLCIRPNVYVLTGDLDEAFSPLSLSPSLWLDASDTSTITASSGSVSQWNDKSGNGYHFAQGTGANQPATGTHAINGQNVLRFDGSRFLQAANAMDWKFLTDGSVKYIIGAVVNIGASSDPNARYPILGSTSFVSESPTAPHASFVFGYDDRSSVSRNNLGYYAVGQFVPVINRVLVLTPNGTFATQAPSIITLLADLANATASSRGFLSINGGAATANNTQTGALSSANPFRPLAIGWRDNLAQTNYLIGSVGEIIIANGANATEENLTIIRTYFSAKWGI